MDGMDGLAGGLSFIASVFFFVVAFQTGQRILGILSAAVAGASLGFLPHNFHPAKIYMGDAGSTFLGFALASLGLLSCLGNERLSVGFTMSLLILGIPIFDMCYTTVSRFRSKVVVNIPEWLTYTGKDHFHHRLSRLGFSVRQTVLLIFCLSLCLGLSALTLSRAALTEAVMSVIQAGFIFLMISVLMLAG